MLKEIATGEEENSIDSTKGRSTKEIQQSPVEGEETTPYMAMQLGLPPPEPLDLSGGTVSENWWKFKHKYTNYEIATGITLNESVPRVATLLIVIGNDVIDVSIPIHGMKR